MAIGQDVFGPLQSLISQGQAAGLVYIKVTSPIGVATVDPFAAAQDQTTQTIMNRLGIGITMGFGPAPAPTPGEASLGQNLSIIATLAVGAIALAIRPKLSTALVVGGAAAVYYSGILGKLATGFQPAPTVP